MAIDREKELLEKTNNELIGLYDSIYSDLFEVLEDKRNVLHFFKTIEENYVALIRVMLARKISDIFDKCCFISDILLTEFGEGHHDSIYVEYIEIIENNLHYLKRIWSENKDTISGDWFYAIAQKCVKIRGETRLVLSSVLTFERKELVLFDSAWGQI